MLVLTRKSGESIIINETTKVTVERMGGNRIKVLVDAPREIRIRRGELKAKETA